MKVGDWVSQRKRRGHRDPIPNPPPLSDQPYSFLVIARAECSLEGYLPYITVRISVRDVLLNGTRLTLNLHTILGQDLSLIDSIMCQGTCIQNR